MKIGIISDCHLGERRFRKITNHGQNAFCSLNNQLFLESLEIFKENNIDQMIIAGDIFNTPNPDVQSILIANKLKNIKNSNGKDIIVNILGGNHEYSQKSNSCGFHAFNIFDDIGNNIKTIYDSFFKIDYDDCCMTFIPYKSLNYKTFSEIYNGTLNEKLKNDVKLYGKERKHILIFHGFVDLNNDYIEDISNESQENLFALPKEIASNYNLIVSGHIHLSSLIETENIKILTPGSLMPSKASSENNYNPCVYIYDTDDGSIMSHKLKNAPKIFSIDTNDINKELENISNSNFYNSIYSINYSGKMKDVDEYLYKKAIQNSLNISLRTNENFDRGSENMKEIGDFWTFIKDNHFNYYDEFKEFIKEG